MLVPARRGGSGGGGGEPTVRGRRVSSLYKVRATSIIISREPRQDGALDWQTPVPPRANRVIIQTISYFLLFPLVRIVLQQLLPSAGVDDRRVCAAIEDRTLLDERAACLVSQNIFQLWRFRRCCNPSSGIKGTCRLKYRLITTPICTALFPTKRASRKLLERERSPARLMIK